MADSNISVPVTGVGDSGPKKIDTRTVGAGADEHRQVVVIGDPATESQIADVSATYGLEVDVTRIATGQAIQLTDGTYVATVRNLAANDALNVAIVDAAGDHLTSLGSQIKIWDGTTEATVRELGTNDALNVAIVDGSGNQVTSFAGSGGTASDDDADFTPTTTPGTPIMGVYESVPTSVTDNDMGIAAIDANRRVKITVDASTIDVAHDTADSGNPVKIGSKAQTALGTAVTANDRANAISDLFGRLLVAHIDPAMQTWKQVEATTAQTGGTVWDPAAGKKIAVTSYQLGTTTATAGLVTLWFGDNGDTTFSQGTDQVLFRGSLTPTATGTPGVISNFSTPVYCTTADRELHITTVGDIDIFVTVYGYEW